MLTPDYCWPYSKPVHMAAKINQRGGVSPLCAKLPKAIDLAKESWSNREEAVTCPACLAAIASRGPRIVSAPDAKEGE